MTRVEARRRNVAKTRVHELAKEFGVESKFVLEKFKEMGEFVKSASSTVELPAEMRFRKEVGEQLKDTNSPPSVPTWTQVTAKGDTQIEEIVKTGKDPAQGMKDLQAEASSIGIGS